MNRFKIAAAILLFGTLAACDSGDETISEEARPQGVISNQQQEALDAANSVEQILLDASQDREKELEARLRAQ